MQTNLLTNFNEEQPKPPSPYQTSYNNGVYFCNCQHRIKHPDDDCRHILRLKYENLQKIDHTIMEHISEKRDIRDKDKGTLEGAVALIDHTRHEDMQDLAEIVIRWAHEHGTVTSDDLHILTNEAYAGDMIVGAVFGDLTRHGILIEVGRKPTVRKVAHSRKINIYRLKEEKV